MAKVGVFEIQTYFEGKWLLDYLEANLKEYVVDLRNCVNSRDGEFKQLKIYKKGDPGGNNKILVAEADTRYPGMIRVPDKDQEVIKNLNDVLVNFPNAVLILSNCSDGLEL